MATTAPVLETLAPLVGGTPDEVERYRKLAEALLEKAGSGEPVEHWMEGVGRLALALSSRSNEHKAAQMEKGGEAEKWANIQAGVDAGLFGGGGGGEYAGSEYAGGETADVPGTEPVSSAPTSDVEAYIRQSASARGIDPNVAVRVAKSEGLAPGVWQSRLPNPKGGGREPSYGPFQLYTGGGLGNVFQRQTGLNPRDPSTVKAQIDFALDQARKGGWTPWHGAKRVGIGPWQGIGRGETADIPGAEPVSTAPSPEVMAHITGQQPTPAGISIQETPTITGASPPAGAGTVPLPPVPPPAPAAVPPVVPPPAPPPLAARVPQPRPALPVAPAAPVTTGTVAAPAPARPVYAPPVKNDYNAMPGRPPAAMPMRPGQLMQEPYSGPMSAQEFARQGQAAMRARRAGQQPTGLAQALAPGGQPVPPRRNILQALLGRGGPQGAGGAQTAPVASGAPAGGTAAPMDPRRAALARVLADPRVPDALKIAALKNMTPAERDPFTLSPGQVRYGPDGQPIAEVPAEPEKGTDDQREYQQAVAQGYTGSFVDYMREMKKAGATTINTGTPEAGDAALRKKLGEQEGQRWSELKQAGLTSGSLGQDFAALDELIGIAPQGPITGRLAQMLPGASDAGAAFQSVVQRVAPTLRIPGSGATSDIEYEGMLNSLPALQNRPEANRAIAEMMKAKADLNVERSEIITAYESGEIDASTARTQLAGVDRKSIMSSELKQILSGMGEDAATEAGPTKPATREEYEALPSGTSFIDPEGNKRVKP